jgi:Uma2 family endonuclease
MSLPQQNKPYTYEDWLSWDEDVRAEIIDGELYMMAPPTLIHQKVSGEIFGQLWSYLKDKPCEVFSSPVGVRLFELEDTVLEPDIIVVCDRSKLDGKVCNGAPDLVVEVLSPSTARHDRWLKYNLYRDAGVREYWIVDPDTKTVSANALSGDGEYIARAYGDTDEAPVSVLSGCVINLKDVFAE